MKKRKKVTKRKVKRKSSLTRKKVVKTAKAVKRRHKPVMRLELDIPTSTQVVSVHPMGYEFKSQVFIKDNRGKRLLTGPLDFDHAVAIIDYYNNNLRVALPMWLARK